MALTIASGGANFLAGQVVYPSSVKGIWTTIHNSLSATASTAANLATPSNLSDANQVWVRVPDNCTKAIIRGKCAVAVSAVATSPVIYVYGMETNSNSLKTGDSLPSDAYISRRDPAKPAAANATGLTLTFSAEPSTTNNKDATYQYSYETAQIDVEGAAYVSIMVQTAASMTAGGTPTADIKFVN